MKVVCVGDCGIDLYLPKHDRQEPEVDRLIGGITANVARHARDQFPADDEVIIVSCLGDDYEGHRVRDAFTGSGIECLWQVRAGRTPVQTIEIQPDGERRFVRYEAGVLSDFRFSPDQRAAIRSSDLLVAPVYAQIVNLFERLMAVETGGRVAIDFADFLEHPDFDLLERHIARLHIAFFGLSPDSTAAIERIARLAEIHDRLLVVTLGAAGSLAFDGATRHECPVVTVPDVVDTTGAGDAYAATFLSRYCHGATVEASMREAARVAADVVGRQGAY